jgi:hypothetical protein
MVETNPSDEERSNTHDSDDDADQLRTVSQEEEQCDELVEQTQHNTRSRKGTEAASLAKKHGTQTHKLKTKDNAEKHGTQTHTLKTKDNAEKHGTQTHTLKTKDNAEKHGTQTHSLKTKDNAEKHGTQTHSLKTTDNAEEHGTQIHKLNTILDQEGTLLHRSKAIVQKQVSSAEQEASHILKWSQLVIDGWEAFSQATLRDRNRVNPAPLVFAVVANGEPFIQVAHAFGHLAPEDETHPCDGLFGCFLGDRTFVDFQGETVIHEPVFTTLHDLSSISGIRTQPATVKAIKGMDPAGAVINGSPKASSVLVPLFLPLPLPWVPYFLSKRRTNREAYFHLAKHMAKWTEAGTVKVAATTTLGWLRAACTLDPLNPQYSILDVSTTDAPKDGQIIQWTMAHLQAIVPRPKLEPPPPLEPPVQHHEAVPAARTDEIYERLMAMTSTVLQSQVERERPSESAKKLSEPETCRLLGYCGLAWSERHLLPTIWADMKKQPDKASRDTVLAAFFEKLAKQDPSLTNFSNTALVDDIINHRFLPGDSYETCHKGFSPLAFLPKTHADVHEETVAEEHYHEANTKTVMDVRKHRTRGPPPIPTNDAELLRLITRDVTVLTGFFTRWSSLVKQEQALNEGIQAQQMDLFSRPDSTRDLIPHCLWAKLRARRKFFQQTCTREMLDVPPEEAPRIALASLTGHTMLFLSGTKVELVGVPYQWLRAENPHGPPKKARHSNDDHQGTQWGGTPRQDGRHGGQENPWETEETQQKTKAKETGPGGRNTNGPPAFAQSTELNDLLRKHPMVSLRMIAVAAGFSNTAALPTAGLPQGCCLLFVCLGKCAYNKCDRQHPARVDHEAATKLYKALLPGINKLRALTSLPAHPGQQ